MCPTGKYVPNTPPQQVSVDDNRLYKGWLRLALFMFWAKIGSTSISGMQQYKRVQSQSGEILAHLDFRLCARVQVAEMALCEGVFGYAREDGPVYMWKEMARKRVGTC